MKNSIIEIKNFLIIAVLAAITVFFGSNQSLAAPTTGAIFTTEYSLMNGCTTVNKNIYDSKETVALNGGPQGNSGSGLPEGDYYVQVTEPNGTVLGKSLTAIAHVNSNGKFAQCYQLSAIVNSKSSNFTSAGYDTTTNNGGEYKVWASKSSGFQNNQSKTDNFKVKSEVIPCTENCGGGVTIEYISITAHKYYDYNQNGVFDADESPIPGWQIELYSIDKITAAETLVGTAGFTDSDGKVKFAGIVKDATQNYKVKEVLPATGNWQAITATEFTVNAGSDRNVDFGNIRKAQVSGLKFRDLNMNGTQENGEAAIEGIQINISTVEPNAAPTDPPVVETVYTDMDGKWKSGLHPIGTSYTVCENVNPNNYLQTAPSSGCYSGVLAFSVNDNGTPADASDDFLNFFDAVNVENLVFGNIGLVSISGTKYKDADMSGTLTTGDSGVSGVTINVNFTRPNGTTGTASTGSGSGGAWTVSGIPEGSTFEACEVVPTGSIATAPTCRTGTAGDTGVDFFNIPIFNIGGAKYYDSNVNGSFDNGEIGVSGVTINVAFTRPNGTTGNASISTGNGGVWSVMNLPEGTTFTACEVVPTGWLNTAPTCLPLGTVNQNISGLNFFNVKLSTPDGGKSHGFWGNKNGQSILSMDDPSWRVYLNGLMLAKGATDNSIFVLNTAATASFSDVYNGKTNVQTPGFNPWGGSVTATNMAYMLSVQLSASGLSVKEGTLLKNKGFVGTPLTTGTTVLLSTLAPCVNVIRGGSSSFISLANLHALAQAQLALGRYTVTAGALRTNQECVKNVLDKIVNNQLQVVASPMAMVP